jgi:ABC-2 type transport system permease protein
MITCLAFWTTRVYSVSQFFYLTSMLLSGSFVPLQLLPDGMQVVARLLPFQMFRYVPVETILNQLPLQVVLQDYAVGLVWLVILQVGFMWVWREGVRRFSAVGA